MMRRVTISARHEGWVVRPTPGGGDGSSATVDLSFARSLACLRARSLARIKREREREMETSALSPVAMVAEARVAFSTYCMCTGNMRWWRNGEEGAEVTGRGDSCDSLVEPLSSSSLSPFLSPCLSLVFPAVFLLCQFTWVRRLRSLLTYRSAPSSRLQ